MKIKLSVVSLIITLSLIILMKLLQEIYITDWRGRTIGILDYSWQFFIPYIYFNIIMIITSAVLAIASFLKREFGIYILYSILSIIILSGFSLFFYIAYIVGVL